MPSLIIVAKSHLRDESYGSPWILPMTSHLIHTQVRNIGLRDHKMCIQTCNCLFLFDLEVSLVVCASSRHKVDKIEILRQRSDKFSLTL